MKGYYKKEAETREVMEGGWFHTGDIGHLDADGFLVITDRKKDLIVTAGGKNIAPQPIENLLKTSPYIANAVVIGDRRRFIAALVVPDFEKLQEYAKAQGIAFATVDELSENRRIVDFLKAEVDRATPLLASYERVKKIAILAARFRHREGRDHALAQGPAGERHGRVPGADRRPVPGRGRRRGDRGLTPASGGIIPRPGART